MVKELLRWLTSLRLTVVCLSFALILVFVGTVAQVNEGLYQAQNRYFKSVFIYWSPQGADWKIPILPGGYLVGTVLLANIIAIYSKKFGFARNRLGLLLIHGGLVLLLLGQLCTDLLSVESSMQLTRGQSSNYAEDFYRHELVVIDKSDPEVDQVVSLPDKQVAALGEIRQPDLPVTIKVLDYWPNAEISARSSSGAVAVQVGQGVGASGLFLRPRPVEASSDTRNTPAARIELVGDQGSLGTWILSSQLAAPQGFDLGGRHYEMALRVKRHYKPYTLTLLDLRHDVYKGTDIPRNFSSMVRLQNPSTGEDREVLIYMNNPLRYQGDTFYQYQMNKASDLSVLQVVRNPSWLTPYLACVLVGLGLTVQFLTHLFGFIKRRSA